MSNVVSALGNVTFDGFAKVSEVGPFGMITLRAKPDVKGLAMAIKAAVGLDVPALRQIESAGDKAVGWMGPDEYLLILPYGGTAAALAALEAGLKGQHFLAVVVSDARAVFDVKGAKADQVISKLAPVDFAAMGPKELRRTRTAQVAAAFWAYDGGYRLVCFRSVAGYVMGLLSHSAMAGSALR